MNNFLKVAAVCITAISINVASPGLSHADVTEGKHVFKLGDESYSKTDRNGTFHAQGKPTSSKENFMPWSYQISPNVQKIASGPMTCTAGVMGRKDYSDTHKAVPVSYHWHSTVAKNKINTNYTLHGTCTFPVKVGWRKGKAVLGLKFNYTFFSGVLKSAGVTARTPSSNPEPITSSLVITYDE